MAITFDPLLGQIRKVASELGEIVELGEIESLAKAQFIVGNEDGVPAKFNPGINGQTLIFDNTRLLGLRNGSPIPAAHNHAAGDITIDVFANARISQSSVIQHQGAINHGSISGLLDDNHTIYSLLAGRVGGQTQTGGTASGDNYTITSTSNPTKGKILFGTSGYNELNNRLGIGTINPVTEIEISTFGLNSKSELRISTYNDQLNNNSTLCFLKSHTDTQGANVTTLDAEVLGRMDFFGVDSSNNAPEVSARIDIKQNGAAGAKIPSDMRFFTSDDTVGLTLRIVIDKIGNAIFEQKIQIKGGVPGLNKVLTSDAVGLATWETPTGGGWTDDGTVVRLSTVTDRVGIGIAASDASALLDLTSIARGFLPPRMTTTQRDAITSPAKALLIYNTTVDQWEGNNGTPASPNWVIIG